MGPAPYYPLRDIERGIIPGLTHVSTIRHRENAQWGDRHPAAPAMTPYMNREMSASPANSKKVAAPPSSIPSMKLLASMSNRSTVI